jgi:SAM-dependent methyltransferase
MSLFICGSPVWLLCLLPASITCFAYIANPPQQQHALFSSSGWSRQRQGFLVLQAAKRRGGAMARRKTREESQSDNAESNTEGFENESMSTSQQTLATSKSDTIYSMPSLYDLAFGYRCYEEEVEFLLHAHDKYSTSEKDVPLRILELAAGPARHSLAALSEHPPSNVDSVVALDLSQAMVKYGVENADHELGSAGGRRDSFEYASGDMRDFVGLSSTKFDTAWILLGSMSHLLTNDDVIRCFSCLRSALKPGGTAVIELPHPRETFSMGECTRNGWTVPLVADDEEEYGELNIVWGDEDDSFDPIAQVRHFTVAMTLTVNNPEEIPKEDPLFLRMNGNGKTEVKEVVPMRLFTLQEIDALARCAGLEIVAKYGALDEEVAMTDEDDAYRMVCILRCKE